jgi:hypothetical protein
MMSFLPALSYAKVVNRCAALVTAPIPVLELPPSVGRCSLQQGG